MSERPKNVLILSHGHPDLSPGGGEHAAYLMFKELQAREGHRPLFLAAHDGRGGAHGTTPFSAHRNGDSEILFHTSCDPFRFRQPDAERLHRHFVEFLDWFQPDVVHIHHYVNFGVETLRTIRTWSPTVPIVVTLHEYLAICASNGQMVKPGSLTLCERASPAACSRCFPDRSPQDFFLRELYIKSMFDCVDLFVCPSRFLLERYRAWGIPEHKMVVLENGQEPADKLPPRPLGEDGLRGRFSYLGQINPYKGLDVLLDAAARLIKTEPELAARLSISVHGVNLDIQTGEYQERIRQMLHRTRSLVRFEGRYEREDLPRILSNTDWVIIPSKWWENSPLVIQEAFKYGRPLIGSDLGGMREKIRHGENGLLFQVGSATALADCMAKAARDVAQYDRLCQRTPPPPTVRKWVDQQAALYAELITAREGTSRAVGSGDSSPTTSRGRLLLENSIEERQA